MNIGDWLRDPNVWVIALVVVIALARRYRQQIGTVFATAFPHTSGAWGYIKPHLSSTLGVWVLILLFLAGVTVHTAPDTAMKLWWLLPLGLVVVFLILRASTIKSSVARFVGVAAVVFGAGVLILPKLPGSTSGQPPKLTPDQATELDTLKKACPGVKTPFTYLPSYQTVNQSQCFVYFWTGKNKIYINDPSGKEYGPYCEDGSECLKGRITYSIRSVRSIGEEFPGYIRKDPDFSTLTFIYRE